jgi:DNA-binding transcriptional regulator YiaG
LVSRRATITQPYVYELSGLPIRLAGITVWRCSTCRTEVPVIPRLAELHRVIAETLVHKGGPLTGKELRFLRKQAGVGAQRFAELLEVSPEHLSRVENEHTLRLGGAADRLARAVVTAQIAHGRGARVVALNVADVVLRKTVVPGASVFRHERRDWRAAAQVPA